MLFKDACKSFGFGKKYFLFNWFQFFLWIVATRRTKRFQLTDDVFQIAHVNIETMNILESDIARQ